MISKCTQIIGSFIAAFFFVVLMGAVLIFFGFCIALGAHLGWG